MNRVIEVRTGARLHFGLLATAPGDGPFGGIGMMVDRPGCVVQAWQSTADVVHAPAEYAARIEDVVRRVRRGLRNADTRIQVHEPSAPLTIRVKEFIPPHRGFGSGTQLAFAVATAMMQAIKVCPTIVLTDQLGRGGRSGVGTVGFREGGFIIDAGPGKVPGLEPGVTRFDVPEEWRFVVVDPQGPAGPSGKSEAAGFQSLPAMPAHMPDALVDLINQAILPGLAERDFLRFGTGVADFNRLVGGHFAPAQGGIYAHPLIRDLACQLQRTRWRHLAQSSWGPATVAICENEESASALTDHLSRTLSHTAANVFVARPLNRAAEVTTIDENGH